LVHRAEQEATSDEAVGSRSAATVVADALREGILRQSLRGGERLRQDATAVRFGVSQMIVREAFRQLQTEGFLRAEPRRGMSVAVMTAEEAEEMTQLRIRIETLALEWAIPRMGHADAEKAERLLSDLDRAKATNRIIALNARFHETLYAPAGKPRTLALIATLRLNFVSHGRRPATGSNPKRSTASSWSTAGDRTWTPPAARCASTSKRRARCSWKGCARGWDESDHPPARRCCTDTAVARRAGPT
jgi:DNA-binding GntR family transcriptional regulator